MSYIKLDRKITDWEWFTDGNMLKTFIYLLTNAQYKDARFKGIEVKRGQILVGRNKLADRLQMSERQIRTCLNKLKTTNEVTIETTNKYSLISIVKYDFYQSDECCDDQQNVQQEVTQATSKRPASDHNTRNKEIKERKNYLILGEYGNVKLTEDQYEKLKSEFPDYQSRIESVSLYCASTGKKYKDYLATIRNWAKKEKPKLVDQLPTYNTSKNGTFSKEEEEELMSLMKGHKNGI